MADQEREESNKKEMIDQIHLLKEEVQSLKD